MKFLSLVPLVLFIIYCVSNTDLAFAGNEGKGGDKCQDRIEEIRNDISDWIQQGDSAKLKFSSGVSLEDYNKKMQSLIGLTRLDDQHSIVCRDNPKDVAVGPDEKPCIAYFESTDKPKIVCYRGQGINGQWIGGFMGLSEDDQYFQVHHEFAVLAGFEDQAGQPSNYFLSDQISAKLQSQIVKRLVPIKPIPLPVNTLMSSGRNPYDAVKEAFNSAAPGSVQLNDLPMAPDLVNLNPPLKCLAFTALTQNSVFVGRLNFTIPGTPSYGPLVPSTPPQLDPEIAFVLGFRVENGVMILGANLRIPPTFVVNNDNLANLMNGWFSDSGFSVNTRRTFTAGDLKSLWVWKTDKNLYPVKTLSFETTFRKRGQYILFHEDPSGSTSSVGGDEYGYCYPTN